MPLLDVWEVLENPSWIFFGLTVSVGILGFALLMLFPIGRD
jgi:hypothetical protein